MLLDDGEAGIIPNLRVINYSITLTAPPLANFAGRSCGPGPDDDGAGATQPCGPDNEDEWLEEIENWGEVARRIAERASRLGVLIVEAAGNQGIRYPNPAGGVLDVHSVNMAPFAWARANWTAAPLANPIIIVEAIGDLAASAPSLARASFSNLGGDVSAPGVAIWSTGRAGVPWTHQRDSRWCRILQDGWHFVRCPARDRASRLSAGLQPLAHRRAGPGSDPALVDPRHHRRRQPPHRRLRVVVVTAGCSPAARRRQRRFQRRQPARHLWERRRAHRRPSL